MNRFSAEEWMSFVITYRKSNLTLKEFADANNLNASTFRYWVYDRERKKSQRNKKQSFVELDVFSKPDKVGVEIVTPNGVKVCFSCSLHQAEILSIMKGAATCLD